MVCINNAAARCQSFRCYKFRDTKEEFSINKISEMLHYVTVLEIGTEVPFWLCNRIYTCSDPSSTETQLLLSNGLC